MDKYRHELKYVCSEAELEQIRIRISTVAQMDKHASQGYYVIRSLYFDDYYNSSYYGNESGVDPREKWRIRIYNNNDNRILLECKRKEHGKINKKSDVISRDEVEAILAGKPLMEFDDRKVFNRFKILRDTMLLKPAVIVQYVRYPYVCEEGNVRITLDCDISASCNFDEFFSDNLSLRPIQEGRQQLLEVKYDEFLPDEIYNAVQLRNMRQQTFSKYYLCRKLEGMV